MKMKFIAGALLFATLQAFAQGYGSIVTDRPDQTESAQTIRPGRLQIETGFVFQNDEPENDPQIKKTETYNLATTLLRFGLTKRIELRAGSQMTHLVQDTQADKKTETGINGLYVGTKIKLFKENGFLPDGAVLISADLPVGNKTLVADKTEPKLLFSASHTLNDRLGFSYNLGTSVSDGDVYNFIYTASVGAAFSPELGAFVEIYGNKPENVKGNVLIDFGLTFLMKRNLQFDISGGKAFNEEAPDWFANFGFAVRLPK